MRAAAQLLGEALDIEHAHELAVLLAEQRHNARFASRSQRRLVCAHGVVLHDLLVGQALDFGDLLGRHGLEVREVEAQAVFSHQAASLLDVIA